MARIDNRVVGQGQQLAVEAEQHLLWARARKIEPADLAGQQGVAGEDVVAHLEAEATRGVPRCCKHLKLEAAEGQRVAGGQVEVGGLKLRGSVRKLHIRWCLG